MTYPSIDQLQKALSHDVFGDRKDTKKASGRALGTILELISFYLIDAWGICDATSIELKVPEYGNAEITHNVEFALHSIKEQETINCEPIAVPITTAKLFKLSKYGSFPKDKRKSSSLLWKNKNDPSKSDIMRNRALIYDDADDLLVADYHDKRKITITRLDPSAYAIIECKRVGVEEGGTDPATGKKKPSLKGPTTIEKAKQGAYVAKSVSRLQKFRGVDGKLMGIYPNADGTYEINEYQTELDRIIDSNDRDYTNGLTLSIGIVSDHGNWFTDGSLNKELLVLKSSYDWLLFFHDAAMVDFVTDLLLSKDPKFDPIKSAFQSSNAFGKKENVFTKIKIQKDADTALKEYFADNLTTIENEWFALLQPKNKTINDLKSMLCKLYVQRDGRVK
jgi:hypothetical protein